MSAGKTSTLKTSATKVPAACDWFDMLFKGKAVVPVISEPDYHGARVLFHVKGRMSDFGGPKDTGMAPDEGLALFSHDDPDHPQHKALFLRTAAPGTTGMGRRLNPAACYIACRWDYRITPRSLLRTAEVTVTNPSTGKSLRARPVDWGPNEKTGRVADLSPGLEKALGLKTDDICEVILAVALPAAQTQAKGRGKPASLSEISNPLATGVFHSPEIFTCAGWNAAPAKRTGFALNPAEGIVIHHTEGPNRPPKAGDEEKAAAFATARQIQKNHMNEHGWADTGQHFTISQGGIIMEGRHGSHAAAINGECVQAAHAGDTEKNEKWYGIEICGDNRNAYHVTRQQWSALVDLCAWLSDARGGRDLPIIGHQEVHSTTCPGLLMEHLDALRHAVSARRHPTSDVPENPSFFSSFADLIRKTGAETPRTTARGPAAKAATERTAKSAADERGHARHMAAKFIWRYHMDPAMQQQHHPDGTDWLPQMRKLRMDHTLLTPLPATSGDIAADRINTAATTLVDLCLHPIAGNGRLKPDIGKSQAIKSLAAIMSKPAGTVARLGSVLDSVIRFPQPIHPG